jgi:hypothetical protein
MAFFFQQSSGKLIFFSGAPDLRDLHSRLFLWWCLSAGNLPIGIIEEKAGNGDPGGLEPLRKKISLSADRIIFGGSPAAPT